MNSKEMKAEVLFYALYRLHFLAAITEYGNMGCQGIADVFCITDADFTHEFEVKVSKADLAGELASIKYHSQPQPELGQMPVPPPRKATKGTKHWSYLSGHNREMKPNRFSFAVPPDLEEFAVNELKGTPYGIIVVYKRYEVKTVKRAEYLHREKITTEVLRKILHKSSTEIQSIRAELVTAHLNYTSVLAKLPTDVIHTGA